MPRPKKCRRICALPRCSSFGPLEGAADGRVEMAVEEYEAIRLIDLLGCTQESAPPRWGGPLHGAAGVRHRPAQAGSGPGGGEAPAHLRRRLCALPPGRGVSRPGLRPADCGMGRCGCGACLRSKEN
ncbi:MAG: DUF134 domain-containing protein [Flavonifractor plautii]